MENYIEGLIMKNTDGTFKLKDHWGEVQDKTKCSLEDVVQSVSKSSYYYNLEMIENISLGTDLTPNIILEKITQYFTKVLSENSELQSGKLLEVDTLIEKFDDFQKLKEKYNIGEYGSAPKCITLNEVLQQEQDEKYQTDEYKRAFKFIKDTHARSQGDIDSFNEHCKMFNFLSCDEYLTSLCEVQVQLYSKNTCE